MMLLSWISGYLLLGSSYAVYLYGAGRVDEDPRIIVFETLTWPLGLLCDFIRWRDLKRKEWK